MLHALPGSDQRFVAPGHAELGVDVLEVPLDGLLTKVQGLGHAFVGHGLFKKIDDLHFPSSEER
ncbi:hypothetical protein D3C71_2227190 [compost metagenome]